MADGEMQDVFGLLLPDPHALDPLADPWPVDQNPLVFRQRNSSDNFAAHASSDDLFGGQPLQGPALHHNSPSAHHGQAFADQWDWPPQQVTHRPSNSADLSAQHPTLQQARLAATAQPSHPRAPTQPWPIPHLHRKSPGSSQTSAEAGTNAEERPSSPATESLKAGSLTSQKSFKELHAERNKQAQRRFRKRQKEKMDELQDQLKQLQGEKAELSSRNRMLSSACDMRDEELRALAERQATTNDAEEDELAKSFAGSVTLTLREDREITLTPEQIKSMTDRDLARYWAQYVKELAVLLVGLEGGTEAPVAIVERIRNLVLRELLFLYMRAALTNMTSVKRFVAAAKIEEVRVSIGTEGIGRWREVVDSMALTPDQRGSIVELWHSFHAQLPPVVDARRDLHAAIAATIPSGLEARELAIQYVKADELMEALKKNLRQEHVLIHEFLLNFYEQKLTPVQMARCVVKAFPYYPDIPAITLWIAADHGIQDAAQALKKLSSRAPTVR